MRVHFFGLIKPGTAHTFIWNEPNDNEMTTTLENNHQRIQNVIQIDQAEWNENGPKQIFRVPVTSIEMRLIEMH